MSETISKTKNAGIFDNILLLLYKLTKPDDIRKPKSGAKVVYLPNNVDIKSINDCKKFGIGKVSGKTWDLEGGILDGSKQKGSGGQDENQEPLFTSYLSGFRLVNGFIRKNKESISVRATNNVYDHLTFTDIGEDAISTPNDKGDGLRILNCEFSNWGGDKSVQLNRARNVELSGNKYFGGITAIRFGDSAYGPHSGHAKNQTFMGVETAYNASGKGLLKIDAKSDNYQGVKILYVLGNDAKIELI